jgi:hypothetical protein
MRRFLRCIGIAPESFAGLVVIASADVAVKAPNIGDIREPVCCLSN